MEDFKDTVQSRNCLEQTEVFKHYLLLLLSPVLNVLNNINLQKISECEFLISA